MLRPTTSSRPSGQARGQAPAGISRVPRQAVFSALIGFRSDFVPPVGRRSAQPWPCPVSLGRWQRFKSLPSGLTRGTLRTGFAGCPRQSLSRCHHPSGSNDMAGTKEQGLPTEPRNSGVGFNPGRILSAAGRQRARRGRVRSLPAVPPRSVHRAGFPAWRRTKRRIPPVWREAPRPRPASVAVGSAAERTAPVRRTGRRASARRESVPGVEPAPAKAGAPVMACAPSGLRPAGLVRSHCISSRDGIPASAPALMPPAPLPSRARRRGRWH